MASSSYDGMNIMQKLAKARLAFLNAKIGKSGKNMLLEFKYFELEDIVPTAIRIFDRIGLVAVDDFGDEVATKTIYNASDPTEQPIQFRVKNAEAEVIINKSGKAVTNPLQALGSSITYLRRYLWMVALDITEPDNVDDKIGLPEEEIQQEQPKPKAPATPEKRAEVKEELVSVNTNATEEQITRLKSLCKKLMDLDPENQEEFVNTIAMKTDGFTQIAGTACDELCEKLDQLVGEYGAE